MREALELYAFALVFIAMRPWLGMIVGGILGRPS
jgi:hypothetical protein